MAAHEPPPAPTPPPVRDRRVESLDSDEGAELDVLVVGGGITGAGIALDLALRGITVGLVERGDWAGGTSSASSRLVHGGLRYLEQFEFGLVRESCLERALLLRNAAGLVWPERFTFPVRPGGVGLAKLAAGLALYTAVSIPRALGIPGIVGAAGARKRIPGLAQDVRGAGSYLDGATDDARLTLAVVLTAMEAGATCLSRCELVGVERGAALHEARLRDVLDGTEWTTRAKRVVLAGGPFVDELRGRAGLGGPAWVAPTRGAHVLVPRDRLPTDGAVTFVSPVDGRVMFLLAWPRTTCIGTTDLDATAEGDVRATRSEVRYLLDSANGLVPDARLGEDDVVTSWAGLRPLLAPGTNGASDPSARSREERVELEGGVLTIAGGKLTSYRSMAEKVALRLVADLGAGAPGPSATRTHRLRGALPAPVPRPTWSPLGPDGRPDLGREPILHAWAKRYGSRLDDVRDHCMRVQEGLRSLDGDTLLGEADWAVRYEDALRPSDILLRRTDLGLGPRLPEAEEVLLERLGELWGWGADEREAGTAELEAALGRGEAWRADPA